MNSLLEKKKNGQVSVGTFTHLKSTVAIECIGTTSLDYVLIDSKHATMTSQFIAEAITAADAAGITPIVRVPLCVSTASPGIPFSIRWMPEPKG